MRLAKNARWVALLMLFNNATAAHEDESRESGHQELRRIDAGVDEYNGERRRAAGERFTIAFVSDVEAGYRGHSDQHARRIADYIRDIGKKNLKFDTYSSEKVDPELVIHGGDINIDSWACGAPGNWFTCRTPDTELDDVWEPLYKAGIPMISNWGNHDWMEDKGHEYGLVDKANRKSMEFVKKTFEKSARITDDFKYERFPSSFDIGPDTYKATYKGFQIGMFMNTALEKGYDTDDRKREASTATANALKASLDASKPAMFVSHIPISNQDSASKSFLESTIRGFPEGSHHFSGHAHAKRRNSYGSFTDYVASYPQWYGFGDDKMPTPITQKWMDRKRARGQAPGFYAILVDTVEGILEVKNIDIIDKDRLKPGDLCHYNCGTDCPDNKNNWHWSWDSGKPGPRCGEPKCWKKGTTCVGSSACKKHCCNGYKWKSWWRPDGYCK